MLFGDACHPSRRGSCRSTRLQYLSLGSREGVRLSWHDMAPHIWPADLLPFHQLTATALAWPAACVEDQRRRGRSRAARVVTRARAVAPAVSYECTGNTWELRLGNNHKHRRCQHRHLIHRHPARSTATTAIVTITITIITTITITITTITTIATIATITTSCVLSNICVEDNGIDAARYLLWPEEGTKDGPDGGLEGGPEVGARGDGGGSAARASTGRSTVGSTRVNPLDGVFGGDPDPLRCDDLANATMAERDLALKR